MVYNVGLATKGPHKLVAPHELSSQLLLRVRREDRPPALACLDQPQVLRHVFRALCQDTLASSWSYNGESDLVGTVNWPWVQTRAGASRYLPSDFNYDRQPTR